MNYLQMFQRLHSESRRQGTTPTAVTSQTGMNQRLLNWIDTSYEDIQLLHETWLFRRASFSGSTVDATQNYTAADLGVTDLSMWWFYSGQGLSGIRLYSSAADETDLQYVPWDDFLREYKFGARRSTTGRPSVFTVKTDQSIDLWPIPNAIFTLNGEYVQQPDVMEANADIPVFNDFHMAIVWRALMYYGASSGAGDVYIHGQNQYDDLLYKLEKRYLPIITWGNPLV